MRALGAFASLAVLIICLPMASSALEYYHLTETYTVTLNDKEYKVPVDYYVWRNSEGHCVWFSLGVHPLEAGAHKCMFEALKWFVYDSGEFHGTLIVSWIKIPKQYYSTGNIQEDYTVSRELGQLTFYYHVRPYVIHPELLGKKLETTLPRPEFFVDVHAHRPSWGVSEYILIPAGPVQGNTNRESFEKTLQISEILASVIGAKVDPYQNGTSPKWVTVPVAEAGIPAVTFENGYYFIGKEMPVNYDNYRITIDKAFVEALYTYALEGGKIPPTPTGFRKLAKWYAVAAKSWKKTYEYLETAIPKHPEYKDILEKLASISKKMYELLDIMSKECEKVAEYLEKGNINDAHNLSLKLRAQYNEIEKLYNEYIDLMKKLPIKITDVFKTEENTSTSGSSGKESNGQSSSTGTTNVQQQIVVIYEQPQSNQAETGTLNIFGIALPNPVDVLNQTLQSVEGFFVSTMQGVSTCPFVPVVPLPSRSWRRRSRSRPRRDS